MEDPPARPEPDLRASEEAERLVRQARLAQTRGQSQTAADLYRQAAAAAPDDASLLATVGKGLLELRRVQEAKQLLERAKALAPNDANVERAFAKAVLAAASGEWGGFPGGAPGIDYASAKSATLLTLLVPGLGQLVVGQTSKGLLLGGGWLLCLVAAVLVPNGVSGLLRMVMGQLSADINLAVLLPLAGMFVFWLAAVYDMNAQAKKAKPDQRERPKPPVDLPFE